MRKVYAQWVEPEEVTAHEWKASQAVAKWFTHLIVKWSLVFGIPSALFIAYLSPDVIPAVTLVILFMSVVLPAVIWFTVWLPSLNGNIICVVDDREIAVKIGRIGYRGAPCYWRKIKRFQIADHPSLAGIRCLYVTTTNQRGGAELCFRPEQVDEQELSNVLQRLINSGNG